MEEIKENPNEIGNKPKERGEDGRFINGNPGGPGRPQGSVSLIEILKNKLEEIIETEGGSKKKVAEVLIDKLIEKSLVEEDIKVLKEILDRVVGKPTEYVDQTIGGGGLPLLYRISVMNDGIEKMIEPLSSDETDPQIKERVEAPKEVPIKISSPREVVVERESEEAPVEEVAHPERQF